MRHRTLLTATLCLLFLQIDIASAQQWEGDAYSSEITYREGTVGIGIRC